jgi:hypothetical protein
MRWTPAASIATLILGLTVAADLAAAAQPTQAQASAIRSACRSDYQSYCASVPTGGPQALQCLEKNVASLSPSCQKAVNAVAGGAPAAPAATQPAATAAAPAAGTTASPAQSSAPAATAPAQSATAAPAAPAAPAKSAAPKKTVAAKPPAAAPQPAAPTAPPVVRVYTPRERLFMLRTSCGGDVRAFCPGIPLGGGRLIACLQAHGPSLSPNCQSAMADMAR